MKEVSNLKFEFQGKQYKIGFTHKGKIYGGTTCFIKCADDEVAIGRTNLHPSDNFCRETGRKLALTRALHVYFGAYENKAFRRACWNCYFTRVNETKVTERFKYRVVHITEVVGAMTFIDWLKGFHKWLTLKMKVD